ncbi:ABC transporter permease [bacterium]|nr:ABC transporter permease [bacterium]
MKRFLTYWSNTFYEAFRSAMRSLWAQKLRSALTLLSILIGVMTIIVLVSVISGLNHKIAGEFATLGTNVLYVSHRPWTSSGKDWHKWRNAPPIGIRELNAMEMLTLADKVVPSVRKGANAGYKQNTMDATVYGVSWEYPDVRKLDIEYGRFFSFGEDKKGRPVCVLGWEVFKNLFGNYDDATGKWIKIGTISFKVVGVIKKQGQSLTISTTDGNIYIPFNAFLHNFGRRRSMSILVSAENPQQVDELREEIRSKMRAIRKLKPWQEDNFAINSQDMLLDEYNKITRILWGAILAVAGLSLLVGGIGVMNIMLITVTERTREIGVRKALGATRTHILGQFLLEALSQCWLGGTIGFLAGVLIPYVISKIVPQLPFALSWSAVAVAIIFTTIVGVSFGMYPAYKAAKLSPVEALRYE